MNIYVAPKLHHVTILSLFVLAIISSITENAFCGSALSSSGITAVWANDGSDKVTRDELRASAGLNVRNKLWDGSSIHLFGAKNEVVSFNIILEACSEEVSNVAVELDNMVGPGEAVINSRKVDKDEVFVYEGRNIEIFYIRYLQIKGLSRLFYDPSYDERHVPRRFRLPYKLPRGTSSGRFEERPDANKYYPDIAVPIEAIETFDIKKGENQSVWVDLYIPKESVSGRYKGTIKIKQGGLIIKEVPVNLDVLLFTLPDVPSAKTMVYYSDADINDRYFGSKWPNVSQDSLSRKKDRIVLWKNHHLVAHRHKLSLIDDGLAKIDSDKIKMWKLPLSGELFTKLNGYDGPGVGTSSGVYSIGTYGAWRRMWDPKSEEAMWSNADNWVWWFENNLPGVEYFLYLMDEPKDKDLADVEKIAYEVKKNPGIGKNLKTLVTKDIVKTSKFMPSVDIAFTWWGDTSVWKPIVGLYEREGRKYWAYNGARPYTGSFAIEDDGVALRVLGWTQFKHKIGRWFYWESTGYQNSVWPSIETNVFKTAQTFGWKPGNNPKYGETAPNYNNGDGILFYPGTEKRYPEDNYGLLGPIASLRMKYWRRGIQDVDYLTMAAAVDPRAVNDLVQKMIPKVLWEVGVTDPKDPSYVHADISWSTDPDVWESARRKLADIIMSGQKAQ